MTCREFAELLSDYLSGDLSESVRAEFSSHLSDCPDCVAYLQTFATTIRLGKDACADFDDKLPAAVPEELVRAVLAAQSRRTYGP